MKAFFDSVRASFGPLSQSQVYGFIVLVNATNGMPVIWQAYVLATAWHETAKTMQPIAEYGKGKGRPYGKIDATGKAPYGRGYMQLTWRDNYIKADKKLALDGKLAANYDLALQPDIAAKVISRGMMEGWFTGKKISDFTDYKSMRKIVNGTERADLIASYAVKFETALRAAIEAPVTPLPIPAPITPEPQETLPAAKIGLLTAIINLILKIFGRKPK